LNPKGNRKTREFERVVTNRRICPKIHGMDIEAFRKSLPADSPPSGIGKELEALWFDASGDWDRAHRIVQSQKSRAAAAVHAYLHRKEGDLGNADYWYGRAGRRRPDVPLEKEWQELVEMLLDEAGK
jgi:hypothetical protein